MSNPSSDSYRNVTRYQGQDYSFAPRYFRPRDPNSPTNASNDIKPKEQQGYYPTGSFWTNSTNGNLWALQKITSNLANWILLAGGGTGPILNVPVDTGTSPVLPSLTGALSILGGTTFATNTRANPIRTNGTTNEVDLQIQLAGANVATAGANKFGVAQFDDNQFDVTAGFVQLAGGGTAPALTKVAVQTGTNPVVPSATGQISFNGSTVVAGVNPVRTDGTGANTMALEVQISQAIAATDATKIGLANFNSSHFSVDANGFVSLAGGGGAADSFQVDSVTAPGVNPVVPNGSGLVIVAGVGGTSTFSAAANTISIVSSNQPGYTNLGLTYSGSTFTVHGYNGTALSAANPAIIWLGDSTNQGYLRQYTVTANQSFIDDSGASQIIGNTFGTTATVGWATDMPFYLYAVGNSAAGVSPQTQIAFMISRIPHLTNSPVAGKIAKAGSAVASTQGSLFSLANVTVADYAVSPLLLLGSFRMQKTTAATDDWTVQSLSFNIDGIGRYNEQYANFLMPTGQNGNAAGKFFQDNGGTAPSFGVQSFGYAISKNGYFKGMFIGNNSSAVGAGAVSAMQSFPLSNVTAAVTGNGYYFDAAGPTYSAVNANSAALISSTQFVFSSNVASGILQNLNFSGANIDMVVNYYFPISTS